jgi:hypothetical protein
MATLDAWEEIWSSMAPSPLPRMKWRQVSRDAIAVP